MMRDIFLKENEYSKRGCEYCADNAGHGHKIFKYKSKRKSYLAVTIKCPYDECPYHELDDFDSYADYLDSQRWTFPAERRKDEY